MRINVHRTVSHLTVGISRGSQFPRQFLTEIGVIKHASEMLLQQSRSMVGVVVGEVDVGYKSGAVKWLPLHIALHLEAMLPEHVAISAVACVALGVDDGAKCIVVEMILRHEL